MKMVKYLILKQKNNKYYHVNNWIFKIVGKSDREIKKGETFKIDIEYILLSGELEEVSKCWSEGGPKNTDIIFL